MFREANAFLELCRLGNPNWPIIALAPEGMTSNGKQLLRFRTGAFIYAAPVLPVCISYKWRHLNPAWTICNEPWHVLRMLTQFVNTAHIKILPAHHPNANEVAQPTTFAANVRQSMVRCAGSWLMCCFSFHDSER
jgi:lysophosphatidylcholine acyltransferase / lyso-PAF acetyltransferase